MKKIKILTFLFIFSLVTYAWSVNKDLQTISDLTSKKGILSIEEIQENKLYRLKGEWEYYPNVFLNDNDTLDDKLVHNYQTIEHNWSTDKTFNNGFGYASYRLVLKGLDPNIQYGLLLERAGSSYQLYVNNNLTLSNGKIAKSETDSISENFTDKAVFKSDLNGNAEIIVEISNYVKVNSGFDFAPLFGTYDDILNFYETSMIVELFVFSSMFTMSILFFLIAIIIKDRRSFFMAVLTLLFAMRVISTGNHMIYVLNPYIDLSLIWILRIEYISVFLMLPIFALLANTFKIFEIKKKFILIRLF